MPWSPLFELGFWSVAAFAMTVAPRTRRRWALLAATTLGAIGAGAATRALQPQGWNLGKVDPEALVAASLAAALVAVGFELASWRARQLGAIR